jgi:hypothetical protein
VSESQRSPSEDDSGREFYELWCVEGDGDPHWDNLPDLVKDACCQAARQVDAVVEERESLRSQLVNAQIELGNARGVYDEVLTRRESELNASVFVWNALAGGFIVATLTMAVIIAVIARSTPGPGDATPRFRSNDDGYVVLSDDGVPRLVPWPDASNYPAERFTSDCHDVCAVSEYAREGLPPGRPLVIDPEHLTCTCFRPGTWHPLIRYVGWTEVR